LTGSLPIGRQPINLISRLIKQPRRRGQGAFGFTGGSEFLDKWGHLRLAFLAALLPLYLRFLARFVVAFE
jgi:hypothetical protein